MPLRAPVAIVLQVHLSTRFVRTPQRIHQIAGRYAVLLQRIPHRIRYRVRIGPRGVHAHKTERGLKPFRFYLKCWGRYGHHE